MDTIFPLLNDVLSNRNSPDKRQLRNIKEMYSVNLSQNKKFLRRNSYWNYFSTIMNVFNQPSTACSFDSCQRQWMLAQAKKSSFAGFIFLLSKFSVSYLNLNLHNDCETEVHSVTRETVWNAQRSMRDEKASFSLK